MLVMLIAVFIYYYWCRW